ncbi:hypothetical protein AWH63_10015 [Marinobacter sp. C18]|uniref:hypothetical protein n=1 Tax=Marinobacter sp. C18 TaxID=1772288 RepID=UPI000949130D|nr:hypothetical protein [Marinobacter sp. C18]OLF81869.1 hypothetical protein AWH63_10015 [Marinobacter sp. C18]
MTETKNTPLTEEEVESITQKASGLESRQEQVNCVISEVKAVSSADPDYQKSCVIHVLNNRLEIGPHQDVLAQLSEAFPQT